MIIEDETIDNKIEYDEGFPRARRKMAEIVSLISASKEKFELAETIKTNILSVLNNYVNDITLIYDEDHNNLIHYLIECNKFAVLRVIVEAYQLKLDKEAFYKWFTMENKDGLTPLDLSAQKGNEEIIHYMFEIIIKTDEKILKFDTHRNSLFHNAALKNKVYPILFFYEQLQKYFPELKIIDIPNQFKITPLQYACYHKHIQVAEILLDLGANINAQDQEGKSVLMYAVHSNSFGLVKKLLIRGADKTLKDNKGKTAYDVAIENSYKQIADLLYKRSCLVKTLCYVLEIGGIKQIRNDMKTAYGFILYYGFIAYFFINFKQFEIINNDYSDDDDFLNTFLKNALYVTLGIGMAGCTIAFAFFIYFVAFYSRRYNSLLSNQQFKGMKSNTQTTTNEDEHKPSLIDLYKESSSLCIKCKRITYDHTLHCEVCGICVDEWDHHCFWVNICVNSSNKKQFQVFVCLLLIGVVVNIVFSGLYIAIIVLSNKDKETKDFDYYLQLSLWGLFSFAFAYVFLFTFLPLYCTMNCNKKGNISDSNVNNDASKNDIDIHLLNVEKTSFVL